MKTIYVDMDGVLTNFNSRYQMLFGQTSKEAREQKEQGTYRKQWNAFIDSRQFRTLEKFPGADELIEALNKQTKARVAILTSSGGFDRHNDVMHQKIDWLSSHKIDWPVCCVPGRRFKAGYADRYSFLIDDTPDVIDSFIKAGGKGVIHVEDAKWNTFYQLEEFLK